MKVEELKNYGMAFSDAEASWSPEIKARMKRAATRVVLSHVPLLKRPGFFVSFVRYRSEAMKLDLSDLRERGMTNESFLRQQLEYLAMFKALDGLHGTERAVEIMCEVMDASAHEPMLDCLPETENVLSAGDPVDVFSEYFDVWPEAARQAGCHTLELVERTADSLRFDVTWCIWLELAERMGVPDACRPNCHADDLVFPEYFEALGMRYERTSTLACGGDCCDFRFVRDPGAGRSAQERP